MLDRRTLISSAAAGLAAGVAAPLLAPGQASAAPVVGKVLARGLVVPWGLAFLPSGNALVGERRSGDVHLVRRGGGRTLVGTVAVDDAGEGGLLGIALPPDFEESRWVYLYATVATGNRIIRKKYEGGELGPTDVVLDGIPANSFHNGGRIAFGPDGLLYAGTGDAGDTRASQDDRSYAGKILRMTPTGSVPAGNPFGNHVWTLGHRNVQGLAWDGRGRMWASELGQNTRDELNRIRGGSNYGWPDVEGGDGGGPYADPFVTWSTARCSPSGIAVANGRVWVGALRGECLWTVGLDGGDARRKVRHLHDQFGRIRTVQAAPDGSLWITTSNRDGRGTPTPNDDRVIRILLK